MECCGKGVYEGMRKKHAWSRLALQQENQGKVATTIAIKVKGRIQVQASRVDFDRPNWTLWRSQVMTTTAPRKGAHGVGQTVQKAQRVKRKMQITLHWRATCRGAAVGATAACEAARGAAADISSLVFCLPTFLCFKSALVSADICVNIFWRSYRASKSNATLVQKNEM